MRDLRCGGGDIDDDGGGGDESGKGRGGSDCAVGVSGTEEEEADGGTTGIGT